MLQHHKEKILDSSSNRYQQYKDILIASIAQKIVQEANTDLQSLNSSLDNLVSQQKEVYGDLEKANKINEKIAEIRYRKELEKKAISEKARKRKEQLQYKYKIDKLEKEKNKKKVAVGNYNEFVEDKTYGVTEPSNPITNEPIIKNSDINTQDITTDKVKILAKTKEKPPVIDKPSENPQKDDTTTIVEVEKPSEPQPPSETHQQDPNDIMAGLKSLFAENIRLRDEYKNAKLDYEKQKWDDTRPRNMTLSTLNQIAESLNSSAKAVVVQRRILGIGKNEHPETIPYWSTGNYISSEVQKNIQLFKEGNSRKVADNVRKINRSLVDTTNKAKTQREIYENKLKSIQTVLVGLKKANFKPTKEDKERIDEQTKKIITIRNQAVAALKKFNALEKKKLEQQKALGYAKIEKFHYDGRAGSYSDAKSLLDKKYANAKAEELDVSVLLNDYNELMAILGQPIEQPQIVTGEFRGFFSTIGDDKNSAEFDYAESGSDDGLKNTKLITQFGEQGLSNENIIIGDEDHFGDYQYVAMGKWSSADNGYSYIDEETDELKTIPANKGYWILGKPTETLPQTGQASFKGEVLGHAVDKNGGIDNLEGEIGLKADFKTKRIAGKMDVDYTSGGDFATVELHRGEIGISENDNLPEALKDKEFSEFFDADLDSRLDYHGDIVGAFYGDEATEAGGVWELRADDRPNASGVFRAKKTNKADALIPDDPNKIIYEWGGAIAVTAAGSNAPINTGSSSDAGNGPITNGKANIYNRYENKVENVSLSYDDYQYVAWGSWETDYGNNSHGFKQVVYGQITPELPRTGSANYKGDLHGNLYKVSQKGVQIDDNSITGDVNLTANFADRKLSGSLDIKHNGKNWATAQVHPDKFYEGEYRANVSLDKGSGSMRGFFFGKDAAETGGSFNIDKDIQNGHEWINGTYRAKKQ